MPNLSTVPVQWWYSSGRTLPLQSPWSKGMSLFVRRQAFLHGSCLAARRSFLVGGMCSMLPCGIGICCYAFVEYFNSFHFLCPFLFLSLIFLKTLVLINRLNLPRYQCVLALRAFWTEAIPKGVILRKFCVWCLCMYALFCINLCQDWFCRF